MTYVVKPGFDVSLGDGSEYIIEFYNSSAIDRVYLGEIKKAEAARSKKWSAWNPGYEDKAGVYASPALFVEPIGGEGAVYAYIGTKETVLDWLDRFTEPNVSAGTVWADIRNEASMAVKFPNKYDYAFNWGGLDEDYFDHDPSDAVAEDVEAETDFGKDAEQFFNIDISSLVADYVNSVADALEAAAVKLRESLDN